MWYSDKKPHEDERNVIYRTILKALDRRYGYKYCERGDPKFSNAAGNMLGCRFRDKINVQINAARSETPATRFRT